jgi:hypothetical protein
MTISKFHFLIILSLILFLSCEIFIIYGNKESKEYLKNNEIAPVELKLNGYYYHEFEEDWGINSLPTRKGIHSVILFKDGTLMRGPLFYGHPEYYKVKKYFPELNTFENAIIKYEEFLKKNEKHSEWGFHNWGDYRLVGDTLYFRYITSGPAHGFQRQVCNITNIIINDTTYQQLGGSCYFSDYIKQEEYYKFRAYTFSPRPGRERRFLGW